MEFSRQNARERLVELKQARDAKYRAEADELRCLADLAEEYRWIPEDGSILHGERLVALGGDGTPAVAEFAPLEVAGVLGLSVETARLELSHAVATRYRFPRLWALVMSGELRAYKATTVAHLARPLTLEQALNLDEDLEPIITSGHFHRHEKYVKARVMEAQQETAQTEHEQALRSRNVTFNQPRDGVTSISAVINATDATALDATLRHLATLLGKGGSTGSFDERRAKALGILATPAYALSLLQAGVEGELPAGLEVECPATTMVGHTCGQITVDPDRLRPRADLVVHLSDETAGSRNGLARVEKVGPILADWIKELVGHHRVSVRPVLDCNSVLPTDAYEVPGLMRCAVTLRNPTEVFPWSKRSSTSRGVDLDHTIPYDDVRANDRPPTRPDNLGPLSRTVHRAKTHGGWKLAQPMPGVFLWKSPLGFTYLVTPSQTWMIDDPTGRMLPRQDEGVAA